MLHSKDTVTLLELDLTHSHIASGSAAGGIITLCQKLTNIKVLNVEECSFETLSSQSVAELVCLITNHSDKCRHSTLYIFCH